MKTSEQPFLYFNLSSSSINIIIIIIVAGEVNRNNIHVAHIKITFA